jgi:hypothetical protein
MSAPGHIDVIIASVDARATIVESLGAFLAESSSRGGVVLVDASRDGTADLAAGAYPGLRIIRRPSGTLAPELWLAGLEATGGDFAAFSAATMAPEPGWLDGLVRGLGDDAAAVGGAIVPGAAIGSTDRAAYLARYASYRRPGPGSPPAGDNSLYRRDRLDPALLAEIGGFWEVEVLADLRRRGQVARIAPDAALRFLGGTPFGSLARQRLRHGWRYGRGRSRAWGIPQRLARALAAPLVPIVLAGRAIPRVKREPDRGAWMRAIVPYAGLVASWTAAEAMGALAGPGGPSRG